MHLCSPTFHRGVGARHCTGRMTAALLQQVLDTVVIHASRPMRAAQTPHHQSPASLSRKQPPEPRPTPTSPPAHNVNLRKPRHPPESSGHLPPDAPISRLWPPLLTSSQKRGLRCCCDREHFSPTCCQDRTASTGGSHRRGGSDGRSSAR
jgi:hypothetical protein